MSVDVREHDEEPVVGLPERPPEGERVLWRGAPEWRAFARHALHTRKVSVYFALLCVWSVASNLHDGAAPTTALAGLPWLAGAWALGLGVLWTLSWAMCRSTVYTITTKRVVLRFGVAIQKAINIPFAQIAGAAMRERDDGLGDIPITLSEPNRIGFLILWPHARPFRISKPEPMLRCVREVAEPARILSRALEAAGHGAAHEAISGRATPAGAAPVGAVAAAAATPAE